MAQQLADKQQREEAASDFEQQHREIINANKDRYDKAFSKSTSKFFNLENSKKKAHLTKWKAMENLDRYLVDFEANFTRHGGKVVWANDAKEACEEIDRILTHYGVESVVVSKSADIAEIALYPFLEKGQLAVTESDLASFIAQQLGHRPAHFAASTLHLHREEIAKAFHDKFDTPMDASMETLLEKAQALLRERLTTADVGITGADYLVADSGSIAISENDGDVRLATTFPKIHIAVVGIEKVLPNMLDLDLFFPLYATHLTGRQLSTYNQILSGPRQPTETDGPEEMYVILLDNGRTDLLTKKEQRQGLYCMRCASCSSILPINNKGDIHTEQAFKHLHYDASLYSSYKSTCPVSVDIQRIILLNRREVVENNQVSPSERRYWKVFTYFAQRRNMLDFFGTGIKNFLLRNFFKKIWDEKGEIPKVTEKSFSKQWKEQEKHS